MAKTKKQKKEIIEDIANSFQNKSSAVLLDFSGVKSDDLFDLREKLKESGSKMKVAKKTLLEKALEKIKLENLLEKIKEMEAQFALVFSEDEGVKSSKICFEKTRENKNLKILGGFFENEYYGEKKIKEMAKIPSREELLAKLVRSLISPASDFVSVLGGNMRNFVLVLNQKVKKEQQ